MSPKDEIRDIRFSRPENKTGIVKWMWWLYVVTGIFIVCLLIWMFVALSKNQLDNQMENNLYNSAPSVVEQPYQ